MRSARVVAPSAPASSLILKNKPEGKALNKMDVQKIRIRLKAYDHFSLDRSTREIARTVLRTGARIVGPVPLPPKRTVYTVLRSPHVDKKSREQFETRVHKRLIEIYDSTPQTVDALMKLDLPAGVDVEIKT